VIKSASYPGIICPFFSPSNFAGDSEIIEIVCENDMVCFDARYKNKG
jgi:hypothetical protein